MWTYPPAEIVAPVDFGDASARAVRIAATVADRYGARLRAVHAEALEAPPYFTHEQVERLERERQASRARAEKYLKDFVTRLADRRVGVRIVDGSPVAAVLAAARGADLIVMGTHGRRGPSRWWIGSVAEGVVRESVIPVLVVRAADSVDDAESLFRHIVGIAAPRSVTEAPLRYARGLAETFGGRHESGGLRQATMPPRATMLVVGIDSPGIRPWFGEHTERLVSSCMVPVLFVPSGSDA